MDVLYPRLLTTDFAADFGFYDAVIPPLTGGHLVKGTADGAYANWDLGNEALLVLFDRAALAATVGTADLPSTPPPTQDAAMLVFRVDDVPSAFALCRAHGATPVTEPAARPDWGPTLHAAHVRAPGGTLIELQSY